MSQARPLVTEYNALTGEKTGKSHALAHVFQAPLRPDVVNIVHRDMNKNRRQANGVDPNAGHMTSAESWGTGRAVARIPRVAGGGTHRSGQGAFGNMCRGGHMFNPKVIWRRWHRRINVNMKRFAVASAIAASAVPALVMARGHRIMNVPEIPLVVSAESLATVAKTKVAKQVLQKLNVWADVERVIESIKIRSGVGKMRNRRHVHRRGPLLVLKDKGTVERAFRNIPGVEIAYVSRLNLLKLAPGAHLGRLVIWSSDAFAELDKIFGTYSSTETPNLKHGFHLPRPKMVNTDIARLIHSETIRKAIRPARTTRKTPHHVNPLRNLKAMIKLNPYAEVTRRAAIVAQGKLPDAKKPKLEKPVEKKAAKKPKKPTKKHPDWKPFAVAQVKANKKKARKTMIAALFA